MEAESRFGPGNIVNLGNGRFEPGQHREHRLLPVIVRDLMSSYSSVPFRQVMSQSAVKTMAPLLPDWYLHPNYLVWFHF